MQSLSATMTQPGPSDPMDPMGPMATQGTPGYARCWSTMAWSQTIHAPLTTA